MQVAGKIGGMIHTVFIQSLAFGSERKRMKFPAILLYVWFLWSFPAIAATESYNQVDFSSEAERKVVNDLMSATLSIEINEPKPASIAKRINTMLNAEFKRAAAFGTVRVTSGNQSTYPVYGKNNLKIEGWRGHAELRLESQDFKSMGELIAQMQEQMQLEGVHFSLAADTRKQVENTLIGEAIDAFRKRANAVSAAMGGSGYKIVRMSINQGGTYPGPRPMMARAALSDTAIPAPEFAGGESTIKVQISGTVEVIQ